MRIIFFVILVFIYVASQAQQSPVISFDEKDLTQTISKDTQITINYSVLGLVAGQPVTVKFGDLEKPGELEYRRNFMVISGFFQTVTRESYKGKLVLFFYYSPAKPVRTMILNGNIELGRTLMAFRETLELMYTSTRTASSSTVLSNVHGLESLFTVIADVDSTYRCSPSGGKSVQMVQPKTFSQSLKPIFSKVILNNEGLVKNGTAANLNFGNGVDLSALYQKQTSERWFFKAGFDTKLKDNTATIFDGKNFKTEFGLSFGFTQIIRRPGMFFIDQTCADLQSERRKQENDLTYLWNQYAIIDSSALKGRITSYTAAATVKVGAENPDYLKYSQLLKDSKDSLITIQKLHQSLKHPGVAAVVEDSLAAWELRKAIKWSGYQVSWIDYDIKLPFKGYFVHDLNHIEDTARFTLLSNFNAGFTLNHVHYGSRVLSYLYGGVTLYLERAVLALPATDTVSIRKSDKTNLYYKVTNNDWYRLLIFGIGPSLNHIAFFGKDKVIGVEAGLSWRHFFYNKVPGQKNNIWNARAGIIFSLNGEDQIGKGTFGVFAQLVDYKKTDGGVGKNIGIGVRFGIPFTRVFKTS